MATSAEDYYTGHGESRGRWVGSLADELGLEGEVDPEHFRRILQGRHPIEGHYLITAQGSASRAHQRLDPGKEPTGPFRLPDQVGTMRAAAHLGVSARYVRQLLTEGAHYQDRLAEAAEGESIPEPSAYLMGVRTPSPGQGGVDQWQVPRAELDRFMASRRAVKARPGYDLTLRPPKSVSVVWALGDERTQATIRDAHREAVDEVVRYYETHAVRVRQGSGGRRLVDSAGIVAAAFDHRTSRAGDPLLHTHVVTANMTCTPGADGAGEWRAIAGAGLFEHARAAGHLYQAHLRHLLSARLGVQFTPTVNGCAEIDGVPQEIIELFSKRRTEIEELVAEWGGSSGRAAQLATLKSRRAKEYGVEAEALRDRWAAEAASLGFGPDEVTACLGRDVPATVVDPAPLFDVLAGPHGLTERCSTFCRTDVIEAIASASGASLARPTSSRWPTRSWPRARWSSSIASLVETDPGAAVPTQARRRSVTQRTYTTVELAELEDTLLSWGTATDPAGVALAPDGLNAILNERPELSGEQRAMVRAACTVQELIQPIAGRPGAGKTYATEAVVAAHLAQGVPIVGCAVSAAAAAELERTAGFGRSGSGEATTVARLLVELAAPTGGLRPGTVVVVDEASMLGTRDLHQLAIAVRGAGGRIILIGDPDQHGSVDVGGVFRRLCDERGDRLVTLVENNRQEDHTERLAIEDYREGRVDEALARYDQAGKVVRCRTAGECFDAIVADWYADHVDGNDDPMIAGPNSTRRALNDRARVLLKANGELVGDAVTVAGREFMVGDHVVARKNRRDLHSADSRDFVKNGSTGTVAALDLEHGEVVVEFDREGRIRIPADYLAAGKLEHGYARTTYGVQGATHGTGRYVPTDASSFEEGYVAVTRARKETRIYIVDGTGRADPEFSHVPEDIEPVGLTEVSGALSRRRAGHMVDELSPQVAAVASVVGSAPLADLIRRRRELDRLMAAAPPDATSVIDETTKTLDRLRSRRQSWSQALEHALPAGSDPRRAEASMRAIDRSASRLERKLTAAQRQQDERSRVARGPRQPGHRAQSAVAGRARPGATDPIRGPGPAVPGAARPHRPRTSLAAGAPPVASRRRVRRRLPGPGRAKLRRSTPIPSAPSSVVDRTIPCWCRPTWTPARRSSRPSRAVTGPRPI